MEHRHPLFTFVLLLLVGAGAAWIGFAAPGPQTDTLYQYSAVEVSEGDDGTLTALHVESGEYWNPTRWIVDGDVACLPSDRLCRFEGQAFRGDIENRDHEGYRYLYHVPNGTFFAISGDSWDHTQYERLETSAALDRIAADSSRLSSTDRAVIEDGSAITPYRLRHGQELVEYGGEYYSLVRTGRSFERGCSSGGDGFCDDADWVRVTERLRMNGVGLLGLLGVLVGAGGVIRTRRHGQAE